MYQALLSVQLIFPALAVYAEPIARSAAPLVGPAQVILSDYRLRMKSVAFSPNGELLAVSDDRANGLRIFRTPLQEGDQGDLLRVGEPDQQAEVNAVAFSPDGAYVAAGADRGDVYVWDVQNRERREFATVGFYVFNLVFAPDGKSLFVARHGGVERRSFPSGKLLRTYVVCQGKTDIEKCGWRVWALDVSPDGKSMAASGGTWEVATGNAF